MFSSLVSGAAVYTAESLSVDPEKTLCITGHREKNIVPYENNPIFRNITVSAVKLMIYRYIDMAAERGYEYFISGLAVGTDLWAAEYILRKKRSNKNIRLIGAMPYLRHAEYFPAGYKDLLAQVELGADHLVTVSEDPGIVYGKSPGQRNLYRDRNYYMVDRSSAVIAFLNGDSPFSGTGQTVNYAYRTGRKICRFGTEDIYGIIDRIGPDIHSIGREITFLGNVFDTPY